MLPYTRVDCYHFSFWGARPQIHKSYFHDRAKSNFFQLFLGVKTGNQIHILSVLTFISEIRVTSQATEIKVWKTFFKLI